MYGSNTNKTRIHFMKGGGGGGGHVMPFELLILLPKMKMEMPFCVHSWFQKTPYWKFVGNEVEKTNPRFSPRPSKMMGPLTPMLQTQMASMST